MLPSGDSAYSNKSCYKQVSCEFDREWSILSFASCVIRRASLDILWTTASFCCLVHARFCPRSRAYSKRPFVNAIVSVLARARRYLFIHVSYLLFLSLPSFGSLLFPLSFKMVETSNHRLVSYTVCVNHFLEEALLTIWSMFPKYMYQFVHIPVTEVNYINALCVDHFFEMKLYYQVLSNLAGYKVCNYSTYSRHHITAPYLELLTSMFLPKKSNCKGG